uniref:fimbrial protein n=1 Tax=Castellaniella defragrans TaxID=75697 RepID=UPI00333F819C
MKLLHDIAGMFFGVGILVGAQVDATAATITFNGGITSSSCRLEGGVPQQQVTLPIVHVNHFSGVGSTYGFKDFDINLENCPTQYNKVKIRFSSCASAWATQWSDGRCREGLSTSSNLFLELRGADDVLMKIGAAETDSRSFQINHDGSVSAPFKAGYYAPVMPVKVGNFAVVIGAELTYEE